MRKLFPLFLALLATTSLWAYDFQSGDLYYNITGSKPYTVSVTYQYYDIRYDYYGGYENLTSVIIPETVTYDTITYRVTRIELSVFSNCPSLTSVIIPNSVTQLGSRAFEDCSSLTSLIIGNSVTSIGSRAFSNCSSLTSVTLPNSVTSIGYEAFRGCSSLSSLTIPKNVTSIGDGAFSGCSSLTSSIIIPHGVTSIGSSAFSGCSSLTSITIPDGVTNIGYSAFSGCSSLASITIPDGVTIIKKSTFSGCSSLTSITIPNSVTSIENYAFSSCSSLTSITIPDGVTSIGYSAFSGCASLASITIPDGVTIIKKSTFSGCSSLTSFTIPNSVTSIGEYAFSNCSSLESITIPNSVTSIGEYAFYNCSSLTSFTIPNSVTSIGEYAFYNCSSLNSITIPNSVTSIGGYAFYNCSGLTLVTIGDGLTSIGARAFDYCKNIEEIYCYPITPPAVESSSFCNYSKATLYVPCDSKEVYEQHPIFGKFEKIKGIEGCGEYVTTHIYDTICQGDVYEFGEYLCDTTGTYTAFIDLVPTYLHLTVLPRIIDTITIQVCDSYEWHGKVYTESGVYTYRDPYNPCVIEELHLTIIDTPTPPSEPQDTTIYSPTEGIGVFSIGEGKTVTFSRGNLQYTQSTDTWSFAENQWDMIGTDNVTGGSVESNQYGAYYKQGDALADKIDLFCWSASNTTAPFGVSTSADYNDYSGSFVDWGTNTIGNDTPNTWRTLTYDEWDYLRHTRTNANALYGIAQVNGVNGFILLPDSWACPDGVTFKSGFHSHSDYSVKAYGQYQTFTADQWSKLEKSGAVFLPVAGDRLGTCVYDVQNHGYYWSATEDGSDLAYYFGFYSVGAYMGYGSRNGGYSVRLVKDVNSTTPEPPVEPETEEIFIYQPVDAVTICASELPYIWRGMYCTEAGTYTHEEIVEDENYIYHHIYTLELTVIPPEIVVLPEEAYDSYEWHGVVYTESGVYTYEEWCYQEILELTIIPSEDKEYVYGTYQQDLVCNGYIYVDPITGENHLISSLDPTSLIWSDTVKGTEVDTIHTFHIIPIVYPEPLTEDMLYAIGAVPKLVAGEKVDLMGTTELIMAYYQMVDQHDIADVIGVEWVLGHDVVLDAEQTTHTMVLEVVTQCDDVILMEFTFPVSKKDSEPQDTTIYIYHTEDVTICEGETYIWWMGKEYTETGTYTYASKKIVEEDDYIYIYHNIYTLHLMVLPYETIEYEVEAYDSFEWHGIVYTESGTYTYQYECTTEVLYLTIIPSEDNQGEVVVEPSTNSVTITWQKEDDADTYIIVIKQGDKVVCTLIFDAEGNLVSVNYLPGRESNKHGIQHAGLTSDSFQYTITGLTPSTDYTYTVTATDDLDNTISSYSGEFTTHHATSVENTNSQSPTSDCQKILRNGQLLILRDGKTYTIMGAEVK